MITLPSDYPHFQNYVPSWPHMAQLFRKQQIWMTVEMKVRDELVQWWGQDISMNIIVIFHQQVTLRSWVTVKLTLKRGLWQRGSESHEPPSIWGLFMCNIATLNFWMGFNIIAPFMVCCIWIELADPELSTSRATAPKFHVLALNCQSTKEYNEAISDRPYIGST